MESIVHLELRVVEELDISFVAIYQDNLADLLVERVRSWVLCVVVVVID